jgi:hypothetical protein
MRYIVVAKDNKMKITVDRAPNQAISVFLNSLELFTSISSRVLTASKNRTINNLFWSLVFSDSLVTASIILLLGYFGCYLGHAMHEALIRH